LPECSRARTAASSPFVCERSPGHINFCGWENRSLTSQVMEFFRQHSYRGRMTLQPRSAGEHLREWRQRRHMSDVKDLVQSYVALWNEWDDNARRQKIAALWAEDGTHFTSTLGARGHDAIAVRVASAYARFVGTGEYFFARLTMSSAITTPCGSTGRWCPPTEAMWRRSDSIF